MKIISVIIPTYRPHAYLWKCLDSLELQTLEKGLYEVIIVLNGCREPYYSNIIEGIGKYSMIVRVEQTDVAGVSNARNIGLDISSGKYICFIDDDDWVSDSYLQLLYAAIREEGHISVSNVEAINNYSGIKSKSFLSDVYMSLRHNKTVSLLRARRLLSSSCCKMIPKDIIGSDRFDVSIVRGEDALFMAQISHRIKGVDISEPNAVYYILLRPCSASRSPYKLNSALSDFFLLEYSYLKIYLSNMYKYNLFFFIGRFMAIFKGTLVKYVRLCLHL